MPFDPVELGESSFRETPEVFNPVDVDAGALFRELIVTMVDPKMFVIAHIDESVVSTPSIRVDNRRGINFPFNNGLERRFLAVGDDLGVHVSIPLDDPEDWLFLCPSSSF